MADKYLIVGLGNPGRDYEKTRHNAGFWVIDELVARHQLGSASKERKSLVYSGSIQGRSVVLAKPQTYMNLSGEAVRALLDFYKLPVEHLMVIYDDLDTPLGTLKVRRQGSHGGQNGIRNIILHLGTEQFARIRFGIGRPPGKMRGRDYVLEGFVGDEAITARQVTERAADAVEMWLAEGIELTMTRYNGDIDSASAARPSLDEELATARRAHELAPQDPRPLEALARLYRRAQDHAQAVAAYLKLADLHARQGRTKQMLHEWDNAVRLQPDLTELQARIAQEYEALGDTKRATQGWLRLAEHCQAAGDIAQAQAAVAQALRVNPQHSRALELAQALEHHTE